MSTGTAARSRDKENGANRYQRHQPENTLTYRIVERYYPEIAAYLAERGATAARLLQLRISFKVHIAATLRRSKVTYSPMMEICLERLESRIGDR